MKTVLGDRMKEQEMVEAGRRFDPSLPIVARLDGKCFSGFAKGLARPYDVRLSETMIGTTSYLVQETNAVCGYTQSDEITLAWYSDKKESQVFFDGRIQKMVSILASMCSVKFNKLLKNIPEKVDSSPVFDCRVWQPPTLVEATNAFLWRELDAIKNSISMAAQEFYSHKQLVGKNSDQKKAMLLEKGVDWEKYPDFFKRGSYIQRRKFKRSLTVEDLEKLPPKHHARQNPDIMFERTEYVRIDMPPLTKVSNRVDVLFHGQNPEEGTS